MELTTFKTGATYIRVSTHMQDELSPDAQRRLLLEYAKSNHIFISPDHMYEDSGISGRKADKRPEFLRMIGDAKSGSHPFDVILVWKFSRFARNQEESIVYKSLLKRQCNVEVISVTEPIIDGPFGSLIERIIEWMDEYYSIRLSGEVIRGMKEKAMRGGYQARPPLGYKIITKKEPPVIVPEEAEIIKYIFDQYVNHSKGYFDIARALNEKGLKTSHGKEFERRSVEYILQNPTYCGMIRWNRTENESNLVRDQSEWIVAQGHHEAIISKELFDQAQERIKATYSPRGARPSSTYKHWLSGLLKCPRCGRSLTSCKTGKYHYFVCYGYHKGKCSCKSHIPEQRIQDAVLTSIKDVLSTGNLNFRYAEPQSNTSIDELSLIREQLSKIDLKEKRIKEAYRNGVDSLEEYRENKKILLKERQHLSDRLESLTICRDDTKDHGSEMLQRISSVYQLLLSDAAMSVKSEALRSVVEKIVYDKETDVLKVYYIYSPASTRTFYEPLQP